jgi:ankyrin repeat protein
MTLVVFQGAFVCLACGPHMQNPLHFAAMNGHLEIVKMILENTEDATVIEASDVDGATPLAFAVANGHKDVVIFLLVL